MAQCFLERLRLWNRKVLTFKGAEQKLTFQTVIQIKANPKSKTKIPPVMLWDLVSGCKWVNAGDIIWLVGVISTLTKSP